MRLFLFFKNRNQFAFRKIFRFIIFVFFVIIVMTSYRVIDKHRSIHSLKIPNSFYFFVKLCHFFLFFLFANIKFLLKLVYIPFKAFVFGLKNFSVFVYLFPIVIPHCCSSSNDSACERKYKFNCAVHFDLLLFLLQ